MQRVEQRLGLLKIGRIEALCEPGIDRAEEIAGFIAFALVAPEPGKAARGPQFPKLRVLPTRRQETPLKPKLGLRRIGKARQQLAFRAMELRFTPALADTSPFCRATLQGERLRRVAGCGRSP